jgi:hypothetical protein
MSSPNKNVSDTNQLFNLLMVREHVKLVNDYINMLELNGKSDVFEIELEVMTKFPEFYEGHPFLVKKLCKRDDLSMLFKMLDNLDKVDKGTKSLASVELNLGEELADKYLYPVVGKPKK